MTTTTFIPNFSRQSVNWHDPTIWSSGIVPNDPSVDVVIPTTTTFLTGAPYISSLSLAESYTIGSVTISNNNLLLSGTLTVAHSSNLSAGIIDIGNGSSLAVGDSLNLSANAQISMGTGSALAVGGSLTLSASTKMLMASGSSLQVGSLDNDGI